MLYKCVLICMHTHTLDTLFSPSESLKVVKFVWDSVHSCSPGWSAWSWLEVIEPRLEDHTFTKLILWPQDCTSNPEAGCHPPPVCCHSTISSFLPARSEFSAISQQAGYLQSNFPANRATVNSWSVNSLSQGLWVCPILRLWAVLGSFNPIPEQYCRFWIPLLGSIFPPYQLAFIVVLPPEPVLNSWWFMT